MMRQKTGPDILRPQAGVIVQEHLLGFALCQEAQNQLHRNTHAADDRFAAEYRWIAGDPFELVHFTRFPPSRRGECRSYDNLHWVENECRARLA
jgi:hypothetical protein